MDISLENISKRYGSRWIFRDINYNFQQGSSYALIGSNGAGKSTLLEILVGKIPYTKGKVTYTANDGKITVDNVFSHFSIATTAMSLIEEFTLQELIKFHFKFREPINGVTTGEILEMMNLKKERNKFISDFSSGMKQRVKITLAILSKSDAIILDEPGANLDIESKEWFQKLLQQHRQERTLIIASNDPEDYRICTNFLDITSFKPEK